MAVHRVVAAGGLENSIADMGCPGATGKRRRCVHKRATSIGKDFAGLCPAENSLHICCSLAGSAAAHPYAAIHSRHFRRRPAAAGVAAGRLRRRRQGAGRAAAADGHGRPAGQAHHCRSGRVCRPLRGGRGGRGARARLRLSRQDPFHGWADRQAGRSAVHHRQAAVPEHARPGERQSGDVEIERRLHGSRSRARAATGARHAPSPSRSSISAPRPSATRRRRSRRTRRRCARPSST